MQVFRSTDFLRLLFVSYFSPCYCPFFLSVSDKAADLWRFPPISILVSRNMTSAIATETRHCTRRTSPRLDGDLGDGLTPSLPRRVLSRCPSRFSLSQAYDVTDCHCFDSSREGLVLRRVTLCLAGGHAPFCVYCCCILFSGFASYLLIQESTHPESLGFTPLRQATA